MDGQNKKQSLPGNEYANKLLRLYQRAEKEIELYLARAIAQGNGEKKLSVRAIEQQKKAIKKVIKELQKGTQPEVESLVNSAFSGGVAIARKELKAAGIPIVAEVGGINAKATNAYAKQVYSRMADVVTTAGRTVTDVYAALEIDSAMVGAVAGYGSMDAVRRSIQRIAEGKGIIAFIDKKGRRWNMASYVEMLTRTATADIYNTAKKNELVAHGEDLVIVSSHGTSCHICARWEGKTLSLSGLTPGYAKLEDAKAAGLFHPNCRHLYSLYIEDSTEDQILEDQASAEERRHQVESFAPARDISDATQWAISHGLAENINYRGLKIEAVNELNAGVYNTQKLFPELKERFKFIGSCHEHMNFVYEAQVNKRVEILRKLFPDEAQEKLLERAQKMIIKQRVNGDTFAFSVRTPEYGGVSINAKFGGNLEMFKKELVKCVEVKFHPVGCDTIKSVVDHEMGHEIDRLLNLENDDYIKSIYTFLSKKGRIGEELSRYASKSIKEFIAEAWSEYQNNPNPREAAQMIGEHIMSLRKEVQNDADGNAM